MSGRPNEAPPPPAPTALAADPAALPRYSQTEVDAQMASLRRGLETTYEKRIADLEARVSTPASGQSTPVAPPSAAQPSDAGAVPEWAKPLLELAKTAGASPAPAPAAPSAQPVPAGPVTLARALAEIKGTAPAAPNPTPHAPTPAPLGDLDRANLHPNRLTSDMVQRLGPDGTLKYVKEYFAKQGRR